MLGDICLMDSVQEGQNVSLGERLGGPAKPGSMTADNR